MGLNIISNDNANQWVLIFWECWMLKAKFKHSKKVRDNKLVTVARGKFGIMMEETSQL